MGERIETPIDEGTKVRKHEGTKARRHEGTKARRHEGIEALSTKEIIIIIIILKIYSAQIP